jgi:hypothetical protein
MTNRYYIYRFSLLLQEMLFMVYNGLEIERMTH